VPDPAAIIRLLGEALILASSKIALDAATAKDVPSPARTLDDEWLTGEEASRRLGKPSRYLARHWRRPGFEFCRPLPGSSKGFRVSARELDEVMRRRR
jgi:hypothetical protein